MPEKLSKLLAEFQAGNPVATFDKEGQAGGSRKYGYASYNAVIECLKPLAAKGLCWSHRVGGEWHEGDVCTLSVTTSISLGDESVETTIVRPMTPNIQTLGSEITYLKRYQLVALCGMAADEDDDGASTLPTPAASGRASAKPQRPAPQPAAAAPTEPSKDDTLAKAIAQITKCPTSLKRQELLALVNVRLKEGKLSQAEYLTFGQKMITYITDADEVSTNIGSLFWEAHEAKKIDEDTMRSLSRAIDLRITQITQMAKVGGTMKQGT